jgi:hypothetical protein
MHTTMLIMAGYIAFSWAVAVLWIGWSVRLKPRGKPLEASG